MPDTGENDWPRFELVTFAGIPNIAAEWAQEFKVVGVPKALFRLYSAADTLTIQSDHRYGQLVHFGAVGLDDSMCLDPATGRVIEIITAYGKEEGPAWLVNSSLDQFRECVKRVIDRFPFYGSADDEETEGSDQATRAANELITLIGEIDRAAIAEQDGFWRTFANDIEIGDFSIEDILQSRD